MNSLCYKMIPGIQFNKETDSIIDDFPKLLRHNPSSTSVKTLIHFAQLINVPVDQQKFSPFNYGTEKNKVIYGTEEPPEFDLTKIKTKVVLIQGSDDGLVNSQDSGHQRKVLPNSEFHIQENYNHITALFAKDLSPMRTLLDKVLEENA